MRFALGVVSSENWPMEYCFENAVVLAIGEVDGNELPPVPDPIRDDALVIEDKGKDAEIPVPVPGPVPVPVILGRAEEDVVSNGKEDKFAPLPNGVNELDGVVPVLFVERDDFKRVRFVDKGDKCVPGEKLEIIFVDVEVEL